MPHFKVWAVVKQEMKWNRQPCPNYWFWLSKT